MHVVCIFEGGDSYHVKGPLKRYVLSLLKWAFNTLRIQNACSINQTKKHIIFPHKYSNKIGKILFPHNEMTVCLCC